MNWLAMHHCERKNKAQIKAMQFGPLYDAWVESHARHSKFMRIANGR